MNLYEKLLEIQSQIKAPKRQYNKFGGFFYRTCEDILWALKPLLIENKCTIIITDKLVTVGNRYYIEATAKLIDCETTEVVSNTAYAREEDSKKGMDVSQVTGSASTYARKYALNGLLCIDDSKDADTQESTELEREKLHDEFIAEIKRTGKSLNYFLKEAEAETSEELATDFLNNSIHMLRKCPDKKGVNK